MSYYSIVGDYLRKADIQINGNRPWDIQVHNPRFYKRVLRDGDLGLGESYMEQWWDCPQLDEFFTRVLRHGLQYEIRMGWKTALYALWARLTNLQTKVLAKKSIRHHYDLPQTLFEAMLDKGMNYSCAYWEGAETLEQAQRNKLELICRKLYLEPGMKVLDIGCGWGSFALYAAEHYGVEVVGITLSKNQVQYARQRAQNLPVQFYLMDYRELDGQYDRIVSIGMFEHVGYKNYRRFFRIVRQCLADDGLFLLHTIGHRETVYSGSPWLSTYIFPHGLIPSLAHIARAHEKLLVLEDLHNIGAHYDPTLMEWHRRFEEHWPTLSAQFDQRFYRMWKYYLLMCAGIFRSRYLHVWQIVFSKNGVPGGYKSIRL